MRMMMMMKIHSLTGNAWCQCMLFQSHRPDTVPLPIGAMAAYNAVVYAAAAYGTGNAAKRVIIH